MNRIMTAVVSWGVFSSMLGQHDNGLGDTVETLSPTTSSRVASYNITAYTDESNPRISHATVNFVGHPHNLPRNLPANDNFGFILHEMDATAGNLHSPYLDTTVIYTHEITQTVVVTLAIMAFPESSSPLVDGSTAPILPVFSQVYPSTGNQLSIYTTPMPLIQITTSTKEFETTTHGDHGVSFSAEASKTDNNGMGTEQSSRLSTLPESDNFPGEGSVVALEPVEEINTTKSAVSGIPSSTTIAESSGEPRFRPKIILFWSLILIAASTAFPRAPKRLESEPASVPGINPNSASKSLASSKKTSRNHQVNKKPGWEERTLVIHNLDHNTDLLAFFERYTPVTVEKRAEVRAVLEPYGEINNIIFNSQNDCIVEWEDRQAAEALIALRRKPKYKGQAIGIVWYTHWKAFNRTQESVLRGRRKPEINQCERAAAILARAQEALKSLVMESGLQLAFEYITEAEDVMQMIIGRGGNNEDSQETKENKGKEVERRDSHMDNSTGNDIEKAIEFITQAQEALKGIDMDTTVRIDETRNDSELIARAHESSRKKEETSECLAGARESIRKEAEAQGIQIVRSLSHWATRRFTFRCGNAITYPVDPGAATPPSATPSSLSSLSSEERGRSLQRGFERKEAALALS